MIDHEEVGLSNECRVVVVLQETAVFGYTIKQ